MIDFTKLWLILELDFFIDWLMNSYVQYANKELCDSCRSHGRVVLVVVSFSWSCRSRGRAVKQCKPYSGKLEAGWETPAAGHFLICRPQAIFSRSRSRARCTPGIPTEAGTATGSRAVADWTPGAGPAGTRAAELHLCAGACGWGEPARIVSRRFVLVRPAN